MNAHGTHQQRLDKLIAHEHKNIDTLTKHVTRQQEEGSPLSKDITSKENIDTLSKHITSMESVVAGNNVSRGPLRNTDIASVAYHHTYIVYSNKTLGAIACQVLQKNPKNTLVHIFTQDNK